MNKDDNKVIPSNNKGVETDTSSSYEYSTAEEAIARYQTAKKKLLDISNWHAYAGKGTANFQLTDMNGIPVSRTARKGDHFRINIPGPGSNTGDGFDWVQIEDITEDLSPKNQEEYIAIKVRPASNPKNSNPDTAHFFADEASSTFIVRRKNLIVSAEVHGRNEKPNTNTENIIDKARNIAVSVGAMLGFSKIQWKSLTKGLIST